MSKIRWGILSTARINRSVLEPLAHANRSELVAVASRDLAKAQAYAEEKGIAKAYGSYEELLADPNIDVIYNPLPNGLHAEWTIKAAEAGKHVLCEKPLVLTLAELDRVEAAAKANNVTVFEAFMYLHHPQIKLLQEIIQSGGLGKLQFINSWFSFYLPAENSNNVRLQPQLGGGSMWDVGVYPNSLAIVMAEAGPPVEVWATQTKDESGVDVAMQAQMRFANGITAQIACGFRAPFRIGAQLVGDRGYLTVSRPWGRQGNADTVLLYADDDDNGKAVFMPIVDPYLCEIEAMEACVIDGAAPIVPLSVSRDFLRSVLAIYESAESGQVVKLS
jgi:predicted dehydrogenase